MYIHDNIDTTYRTSNSQDDWTLVNAGEALRINSPAFTPSGITIQSAFDAYDTVLNNAGARPVDRDSVDNRVVRDVKDISGHYIDSQDDVGGWPNLAKNYRALTIPSNPHKDSDGDGYTNLEEWLQDYASEVEKISPDDYKTEIEKQPFNNGISEIEEQPSVDYNTEIEKQPSDIDTTEFEKLLPNIHTTENEKQLSDDISKIKTSTNSGFTTINVGFKNFMEKFFEKFWISITLLKSSTIKP